MVWSGRRLFDRSATLPSIEFGLGQFGLLHPSFQVCRNQQTSLLNPCQKRTYDFKHKNHHFYTMMKRNIGNRYFPRDVAFRHHFLFSDRALRLDTTETSPVPGETPIQAKRAFMDWLLKISSLSALFCLGAIALMTAVARLHPWLELACHFSLHFLLICFCGLLSSSGYRFWNWTRRSRPADGGNRRSANLRWWSWLFLTCYFAWFIRPWVWFPPDKPSASHRTLKVLSWNVWHDNYSFDEIQQVIRDSNADVVALFEVNPNVAESLRPFESEYTSSYWEMESPASVVVLSRVPGTRYDLKHPAGFNMPALEIQVPWPPSEPNASSRPEFEDGAIPPETTSSFISLFANHTKSPTPFAPWRTHMRDEQLRAIAEWSLQQKGPAMVLGDLNTSPWSPSFRDLLKMGRLKDTRVGVGNQASWPAHFGMFGIPIDHFLINDQLVAHRRHIVRTFRGSDHSAIAIEIAIRR